MQVLQAFSDAVRELPELGDLSEVLALFGDRAETHVLTTIRHDEIEFPIVGVVVGASRADAPTLALIGGVHGLERVGTHVVLAAMRSLAQYMTWDRLLLDSLAELRVVYLPLVNPVGMWLRRRSNGNGVDLMRNAPAQPDSSATLLIGGQQISPRLPWYRGPSGAAMEVEAQALDSFVREWVFPARYSIALDVHSGFGMVDRLWFPYAHTRRPFPSLAEAYALERLLDDTLPNHVYVMEPVSRQYLVQGDLWDYLYDQHGGGARPPRPFMPLTLELGSWAWVKKNPRQIFDVLGGFNPMRPHRLRRTLRRHQPLVEFLMRAVAAGESWSEFDALERRRLESDGFRLWFGEG